MKIFITRNLDNNSVFYSLADAEIKCFSYISIEALPFNWENKSSWLFFYSKNGIKYFFEKVNAADVVNCKIGVMGYSSAKYLMETIKKEADFIASPDPGKSADQFKEIAKSEHITFIKSKNSLSSFEKNLSQEQYSFVEVYNNTILDLSENLSLYNVLIFTSPMNVEGYLLHNTISATQEVIAIGKTTAGMIKKQFPNQKVMISKESSEEGVMKILRSMGDRNDNKN